MTTSNPGFFASKKQAIDIIAGEETYNNLSTFTDIEDLNETVRVYKDTIKADIKRTDVQARLITLLKLLKEHSCKYLGVSFMWKNTIAKQLKCSYKTVQRLTKKLEELGMIKQLAMKSVSNRMLQTGNAILILPISEEKSDKSTPKMPKKCPTNKTITSFLKQNIKRYKERKAVSVSSNILNHSKTPKQIDYKSVKESDFIPHWIPESFSQFVKNFYSDSKTIKEFWIIVKQCNTIHDHSTGKRILTKDQEIHMAIAAFKEFVSKVKSGVYMKKGIFAYFNGIVNNLISDFYSDLPEEYFEDN